VKFLSLNVHIFTFTCWFSLCSLPFKGIQIFTIFTLHLKSRKMQCLRHCVGSYVWNFHSALKMQWTNILMQVIISEYLRFEKNHSRTSRLSRFVIESYISLARLRWSRSSLLSFSTKVRWFKPGRSRRIFRAKKFSARLPSEGK